jgi:magnesium transporter
VGCKTLPVIVDCALYEQGVRRAGVLDLAEVSRCATGKEAFVWLGLYEPSPDEFEHVRHEFRLHPLAVEDALLAHQRPKLEQYDESVFMVLKTARYLDDEERVEFGEIQIFIGEGFLVHVRHGEATPLRDVRKRVEAHPELLRCGPSAVLYAIADFVVDSYAPVIAGLDNDVHEVEREVFSDRTENPVERIYFLKRQTLEVIAALEPLEGPLSDLANHRIEFVAEDTQAYFRDVHDHLARAISRVATINDVLNSVLSANLTRVSVRQNEDMRKISAWVAILAVPTAVAGVYGMNFKHMPELNADLGYPIVIVLTAIICFVLYRGFKRSGWL